MKNISFDKTVNKGGIKAGVVFCALILAAACGKNGGNTNDPNDKTVPGDSNTADSNKPADGNKPADSNGAVAGQVTATDAGKSGALKFATFYQDKTKTNRQFSFALTDYDYCAFSADHNPGGYPAKTQFANLGFYLPGDASGTPLKPGAMFEVGKDIKTGTQGDIGFTGFVDNCTTVATFPWPAVKSGTITVKTVAGNVITGSVDLVLQDNDGVSAGSIKGDFTTAPCTQGTSSKPIAGDAGVCQ